MQKEKISEKTLSFPIFVYLNFATYTVHRIALHSGDEAIDRVNRDRGLTFKRMNNQNVKNKIKWIYERTED